MAPKDHAEFLDIIELYVAPIDENAPLPTFASVNKIKTIVDVSSESVQISESTTSIKDQYFEAVEYASQLPKEARLETFNSFHQKCASYLINVFKQIPLAELKCAIKYAQKFVNISLLNYALSVALYHREDSVAANFQIPSHLDINPGMYFDLSKIISDFRNEEVTEILRNDDGKIHKRFVNLSPNDTATDRDPEHRVAYFREDIGLNLHHRHWHEVYPFDAEESIVKKDRRGELFYYMHQQIVARYDFERLCNGLPRVKPFDNFREPIEEAYFPKLDAVAQSSKFSSRPANTRWNDLHREFMYVKVSTMEQWRDRIFDSIDRGYAYTKNEKGEEVKKKIDEETGIDELGNTIEAAPVLSWNFKYYGDMHNAGHLLTSYAHDPDYRFRENSSVMSHPETTMRDPMFYRWHAFQDDIFQHYKRTLQPYTIQQKQFKGININSVKVQPQDQTDHHDENVLKTFYEKDAADVTKGILDQDPNETKELVYAVFFHLQHEEFQYVIEVTNDIGKIITGTVRIFMAPHVDESGLEMKFNGQRRLFIEMDKFTHQLEPGKNTITRKSTQSSVTIPFEKTFMTIYDVKKLAEDEKLNEDLNNEIKGYCGCGWPHHLLVGKGTTGEGYLCDLFVMITNYEDDKVEDSPLKEKCCDKTSLSYCGVRNKKYPDKKPMGFPFDRDVSDINTTLRDFMTDTQRSLDQKNIRGYDNIQLVRPRLSNMMVVPLRVRHDPGPARLGKSLRNCGYTGKNCKY